MKDYANYSNWDPSKGDFVKSNLIEQRNIKKKNRRVISFTAGVFIGILLLIILIFELIKQIEPAV